MQSSRDTTPNPDSDHILGTRFDQANDIIHRTWATRSKDGIHLKTRALHLGYQSLQANSMDSLQDRNLVKLQVELPNGTLN